MAGRWRIARAGPALVISLLCVWAAGSGCSLKSRAEKARVTIAVAPSPAKARADLSALLARVGGGEGGTSEKTAPASIDGFTCIAVNVSGPGIEAASSDENICVNPQSEDPLLAGRTIYFGALGGFVPLATGGEIEVEVPTGPSRLIQVVAVQSASGACPSARDAIASQSVRDLIGRPYDVGRVVLDIFGDTTAMVQNDYDPLAPREMTCGGERSSEIALYSVAPTLGDVGGGAILTLTGTGFTPTTQAFLGGEACTILSVDAGVLTCMAPVWSFGPGIVDVRVEDGDRSSTLYAAFEYIVAGPMATVTQVSPTFGPVGGGAIITISGYDFDPGATVTIGGRPCAVQAVSPSSIECLTPAQPDSNPYQTIAVTNPATSPGTLPSPYEYTGPPVVTSFTPAVGSSSGGTYLVIEGSNFRTGLSVELGSTSCALDTVGVAAIGCTTLALSPGPHTVRVRNLDGQEGTGGDFEAVLPPSALTYNVTSRIYAVGDGGYPVITIASVTGENLTYSVAPALPAGLTISPANGSISGTCATPSTSQVYTITAANAAGDTTATVTLGCEMAPVVSGVSPGFGPIGGSAPITITGQNFQAGAEIFVGGNPCQSVTFNGPTEMYCVTPAGSPGMSDVAVRNPSQIEGGLVDVYEYTGPPTVGSIDPATGPVLGGTLVTILGSNFRDGVTVELGAIPCANATRDPVAPLTKLTCTTGAGSGGPKDVQVTNVDQQLGALPGGFTYQEAPTFASVNPSTGYDSGGVTVTINGANFLNGATVTFGGVAATNVSLASGTQLICTLPAHAAGAVDVVVTNPDTQSVQGTSAFTYAVAPESPTLSAVGASALKAPSDNLAFVTLTVVPKTGAGEQVGPGKTIEVRTIGGSADVTGGAACRTPSSFCATATDWGNGAYTVSSRSSTAGSAVFRATVVESGGDVVLASEPSVTFDTSQFTVISANTTITSASAGQNLYVTAGTVTFDATAEGITLGDVFVSGGTLRHAATTTSVVYRMDINVASLTLQGGTIDVTGLGYPTDYGAAKGYSYGPTAPSLALGSTFGANSGGASHGGRGGYVGSASAVGPTYGDYRNPSFPGGGPSGTASGAGGGVIRVTASGGCTIDGSASLVANGAMPAGCSGYGGAAGGSIYLNCAGIGGMAATNAIRANGVATGDSCAAPGGGGGRIALISTGGAASFTGSFVYPMDAPGLTNFKSRVRAFGAAGFGSAGNGGAGTVFLKHSGLVHGDLIVDNGGQASSAYDGETYLPSVSGTLSAAHADGTTSMSVSVTSSPALTSAYTNLYKGYRLRPDVAFDNSTPSDWTDDGVITIQSNTSTSFTATAPFGAVASGVTFRSIELLDHLDVSGGAILESNGDVYVMNGSLSDPGGTGIVLTDSLLTLGGAAGAKYALGPISTNLNGGVLKTAFPIKGTHLSLYGSASLSAPAVVLTGALLVQSSATSPPALVTRTIAAHSYSQTSGKVAHPASTNSTAEKLEITLSGGFDLSGGEIEVNGLGYTAGFSYGPNGPTSVSAPASNQGGSHGGSGGSADAGGPTPVYGNYRDPQYPGSGGPPGQGSGGGVVRITAASQCGFTGAGSIRADGLAAAAGGSVLLACGSFASTSWTGTVSVRGGGYVGSTPGGGGGRIALVTPAGAETFGGDITPEGSPSSVGAFLSRFRASGGPGFDETAPQGGAGTIYVKHAGIPYGNLYADNSEAGNPYKGGGNTRLVSIQGSIIGTSGSTITVGSATPPLSTGGDNRLAGMRLRPDVTNEYGTVGDWSDDNILTVASNTSSTVSMTGALGAVSNGHDFRSIDILNHLHVGGRAVLESFGDVYVINGAPDAPGANPAILTDGTMAFYGAAAAGYAAGAGSFNSNLNSGSYFTNLVVKGGSVSLQGGTLGPASISLTGSLLVNTAADPVIETTGISANTYTQWQGIVRHPAATATATNRLLLNIQGAFTMYGGSIDVSARGYSTGFSFTEAAAPSTAYGGTSGSGCGFGASHGGQGGWGPNASARRGTYGDYRNPNYPGASTYNGRGGGVVRVAAGGLCVIDTPATIRADADTGASQTAGGSIFLSCQGFGGSASGSSITANGSSYGGGAGAGSGGGRIALISSGDDSQWTGAFAFPSSIPTLSTFKSVVQAKGGSGVGSEGGVPCGAGGAGTVFAKHSGQANGTLIVDNSGVPISQAASNGPTYLVSIAGTVSGTHLAGGTALFPSGGIASGREGLYAGIRVRPDLSFTNATSANWLDDNIRVVDGNTTGQLTLSSPLAASITNGQSFRSIDILDYLSISGSADLETDGDIWLTGGILENTAGTSVELTGGSWLMFNGGAGLNYPGFTGSIGVAYDAPGTYLPRWNTLTGTLKVLSGANISYPSGGLTAGGIDLQAGTLIVNGATTINGNITQTGGILKLLPTLNVTGNVTLNGGAGTEMVLEAVGAQNFTINNGLLKHEPTSETTMRRLTITLGGNFVMTGGEINVTGLGYLPQYSYGPTVPSMLLASNSVYGGGSHGGRGGTYQGVNDAGPTYDDLRDPKYPGGGGRAGKGGGVVRIAATGSCQIDNPATIRADAEIGAGFSGAGGTVNLRCASFQGSAGPGAITANGDGPNGGNLYRGGGGGRIALVAQGTKAGAFGGSFAFPNSGNINVFKDRIRARGGPGGGGQHGSGAAGTIYVQATDAPFGAVIIDNSHGGPAPVANDGWTEFPFVDAGPTPGMPYMNAGSTGIQLTQSDSPLQNMPDLFAGATVHLWPAAGLKEKNPLDASHQVFSVTGNTDNVLLTSTPPPSFGGGYEYRIVYKLNYLEVAGGADVRLGGADLILDGGCDLHSAGPTAIEIPAGSKLSGNAIASAYCRNMYATTKGATLSFQDYYLYKILKHFLYQANLAGNVSGWELASNGAVASSTPGGSPPGTYATGSQSVGVAADPLGRFVYVANLGSGAGVSGFTINPGNGQLTLINGSPFLNVGGWTYFGAAIDPKGRYLYVTRNSHNLLEGFQILGTGTLSPVPGGSWGTGSSPNGVIVDPTARYVYVANYGSGTVSAYSIVQNGGNLNALGSVTTGSGNPIALATDPNGKFVYTVNSDSPNGTVSGFQINADGALTSVGPPIGVGSSPKGLAVSPNGAYLFVGNYDSGTISRFSINPATGVLTSLGADFNVAANVLGLITHPSVPYLYGALFSSNAMQPYSIDSGGGLTLNGAAQTSGNQSQYLSIAPVEQP
jgi:6-phosphogluconolactonase (cycloisomerase 2 family)